ncbi:MAG: phosphoribosylglycinamide formyltransferase [Eubacteriales bacterium]
MKNIAVLVSGGGTNLQALINAQNDGRIKGGLIALVLSSSPEAYALERAQKNKILTCIIDHTLYKNREAFSAAIAETLDKYEIDLVVFAGFNYILNDELIRKYLYRMINVHPALIPSFCGKGFYGIHTHKAVLKAGVKLTGATVHFVNEVADGGPIILQKAVTVCEGDTPEILQQRVMEEAEWVILPEAVSLFCSDRLYIEDNIVHIK